ncbi:hypothetical protein [Amnibacterium kyonggiense]
MREPRSAAARPAAARPAQGRPAPDEAEDLDALRRRIYRPDATEADRRAYGALLARLDEAAMTEAPPGPVPDPVPGPAGRPARRVVIAAAGVAVVVLLVGAVLTAREAARPPTTAPSAVSMWAGAAAPTPASIPASVSLDRGGVRIAAQRTLGGGSAILPLRLDTAPTDGGRLLVRLTSSDPSPIGWLAERPRPGSHDAGAVQVVATDPPALRQGRAGPTIARWSGPPPTQLVVRAPEGTGWSITVAFMR